LNAKGEYLPVRNPKYLFFVSILFMSFSMIFCARKEGQTYQYDWNKVDEKSLNERQPPGKVMDALGVKPGMVVGEVGAGGGRYAVKMAERVGSGGKVYANDIAQNAIDFMTERFKKNNITNIEVILGSETEPNFPRIWSISLSLTDTSQNHSKS